MVLRRVFLWGVCAFLTTSSFAASSCVEELLALPESERMSQYLDLGETLGVPSSVSVTWLASDSYQERYEALLHAAYLVLHENDAWYRELHYRLYGTTKYAKARWSLRAYDWLWNGGFRFQRRHERGQSLADALQAANETLKPWVVESFAQTVRGIPSPSYFQSVSEWRRQFDTAFLDFARTANSVPRQELEAFGRGTLLRKLLEGALDAFHRSANYVPFDHSTFDTHASAFAAKKFPQSPRIAAALVRTLHAAREATLPPTMAAFRQQMQARFMDILQISAAHLLRNHAKETREAAAISTKTPEPFFIAAASELLPPPSVPYRGLSNYRRKKLAAESEIALPEGDVPLENVPFNLVFSDEAQGQMDAIEQDAAKVGLKKQLRKTLLWLATNQRHPSLQSHRFKSERDGWTSYVQKSSPAYRVIWRYVGRSSRSIEVIRIVPHY